MRGTSLVRTLHLPWAHLPVANMFAWSKPVLFPACAVGVVSQLIGNSSFEIPAMKGSMSVRIPPRLQALPQNKGRTPEMKATGGLTRDLGTFLPNGVRGVG